MAKKSNFEAGGGEAALAELLRKRFAAANQITGSKPFNINSISPAQRAAARATIEERGRLANNKIEAEARNPKRFRYSNNRIYYDGNYVGDMVGGKPVYKDGFNPGGGDKPSLKIDKKEEDPKPKVEPKKPVESKTPPAEVKASPTPVRASEQQTTTTRTPAPKPKPKPKAPSKPVAKPSETYKDGGKGLYQGSKEYRDKVGGSGNPLLNRFRRDMGRDAKTGERQYSTPADKSKYVDQNGKLKIQDKPQPASKPNPPTTKTGGNTPLAASKPVTGGTPFNTRNRFETPEQRKKRLAREGRA